MTGGMQKPSRHGSQPASAKDSDRRRDAQRSPDGPISETIRRVPPTAAHITHALNVAIVQLQNAEQMMPDADPNVAVGQLDILHAIVVRLRRRAA
jgi:hypothetical protein